MARKLSGKSFGKKSKKKLADQDEFIIGTDDDDKINGRSGDDDIDGGDGDDRINGGSGDDVLAGSDGNDKLKGGGGDDTLTGGAGDDKLKGGGGDDTLDGGSGNDELKAGGGNDTAIYVASENVGNRDRYDGGGGADTLVLDLTSAEYADADVQADILAYLDFLQAHIDPETGEADGAHFQFSSFDLEVRKFENLKIIVDGEEVDPSNPNSDPVAGSDSAATNEDTPVTITAATLLANDTDSDGDTLAIQSVGNAVGGTVALDLNGDVVFTPSVDFSGTATFDYTVSDGNGGTDTTTVTIDVAAVNDAPVALADSAATNEDTAVTISAATLLANDTDVDGDTLSIQSVGNAVGGTVALDLNGDVVFTPDADFSGTATFDYTVSDGNGGTATTTVTVDVAAVNDDPVAVADSASTNEDTPVTISAATLLANDTDTEGDALAIQSVGNAVGGTVALDLNGDVVFTPSADFSGTATFDYTVSDGNGGTDTATVTVDVAAVNDAPVAVADSASTNEDTPVTIAAATLLANDTDTEGDVLTIQSVGNAVGGTVALDLNGDVVFTPDTDFSGTATFDYTVSDGNSGADTATVTVNVAAVADAPSVSAANVTADGQNNVDLDISTALTDTDGSESIDSIVISGVPNGASLTNGIDNQNGTWTLSVADLADLTLSLPIEITEDVQLGVTVTSIEASNGDTANATMTFTVTARPTAGVTIVGDSGIGALSIDSAVTPSGDTSLAGEIIGGSLTTDGAVIGNQVGSAGTATIDGGTLNVGTDSLIVGNEGSGSLSVSNGGSVAVDNGITDINTYGPGNDVLIGGSSTGSGTVTVTGTGSSLTTAGVDNAIQVGDNGGTGTLNVENGGTAETMWLEVARNGATGTVNVTGSGSTVIVSPERGGFSVPYDYESGFVNVGRHAGSDGTLNITNGGRMEIREGTTQNTTTTAPGINIGRDGATGRVLVDGAGSVLSISQTSPDVGYYGPFLQVGRGGSGGGTGELTISNGGEVSMIGESSWANIGRSGGSGSVDINSGGSLNIDGLGSYGGMNVGGYGSSSGSISVDGLGSSLNVAGTNATVNIGRGATGDLSITGGATMTVENNTTDINSWNWAGVVIGREAGAVGTATVSGEGSALITTGLNGDVRVGREGGTGALNVLNGATVETMAFVVGRDAGSVGDVTVSGAGSTIIVSPDNGGFNAPYEYEAGWMNVGRNGGSGTVRILNGGRLEVRDSLNEAPGEETSLPWVDIGRDNAQGTVIVDGAGSVFSVTQEGSPRPDAPYDDGPTVRVGNRPDGNGSVSVSNDGALEIIGENAGLIIGAGWGGDGASGDIAINSSAQLTLDGQAGAAHLSIARGNDDTNSGQLHVSGEGSVVTISGNAVSLEAGFNSAIKITDGADMSISGGSTSQDYMAIGVGWGVPDGIGSAELTVDGSGSTLNATVGSIQLGTNALGMTATMNVTNGGVANITTTRTLDDGWSTIGNSGATGIINVDGVGSSLTIDAAGSMHIGNGWFDDPNRGEAFVTASNGGDIHISADYWFNLGSYDSATNTAFGDGHVTATGPGSNITLTSNNYNVSFVAESTVTAENGGDITVNGVFNDWDNENESTLTVGADASMSITGDMALNNSRMEFEVGGTATGSFSQIDVGGNLYLDSGIAHFTFTNGFAVSAGDTFDFISTTGSGWVNNSQTSIAFTGVADGFQASLSSGGNGATINALNNATAEADTTLLFGSQRDDTFDGGAGNDVLDGGGGLDFLTGGSGADLFVYGANDGNDTITDFSVGEDLLLLEDGVTLTGSSELDVNGDSVNDTVLDFGANGSVTLLGVNGVANTDDLFS